MVGGAARGGRGGDGGQARRRDPPGAEGTCPARRQVPRARVPAAHLRAGVPGRAEPLPAALPRPRPQAVPGAARVGPGDRGAGGVGGGGAAVPCARVRVRRAGPGERARRPAALTGSLGWRLIRSRALTDHDRVPSGGRARQRLVLAVIAVGLAASACGAGSGGLPPSSPVLPSADPPTAAPWLPLASRSPASAPSTAGPSRPAADSRGP